MCFGIYSFVHWKRRSGLLRTPSTCSCCKVECSERFELQEIGWRKDNDSPRNPTFNFTRKSVAIYQLQALIRFQDEHIFHCLERPKRERARAQYLRQRDRARRDFRQRKHYLAQQKGKFCKDLRDLVTLSAASARAHRKQLGEGITQILIQATRRVRRSNAASRAEEAVIQIRNLFKPYTRAEVRTVSTIRAEEAVEHIRDVFDLRTIQDALSASEQ